MAKILHIEDNAVDQHLVRFVAGRLGHTVVTVDRISQAIEKLAGGHFDLIICDGTLEQKEDGLRWAEQMAREGRKIIVLSQGGEARGVVSLSKTHMMVEEDYLGNEITKALRGR